MSKQARSATPNKPLYSHKYNTSPARNGANITVNQQSKEHGQLQQRSPRKAGRGPQTNKTINEDKKNPPIPKDGRTKMKRMTERIANLRPRSKKILAIGIILTSLVVIAMSVGLAAAEPSPTAMKTVSVSGTSRKCSPDPRHKKVRLGIYYTDSILHYWLKTKSNDQAVVLDTLQELARNLNDWFSPKKLGFGSKVEFSVTQNNVKKIFSNEVSQFWNSGNSIKTVKEFCKFVHSRKTESEDWDLVFLLEHKKSTKFDGVAGIVVPVTGGGICSERKNCGILLTNGYRKPKTFNIYPPLLAHEIGHTFGLIHCMNDEYYKVRGCQPQTPGDSIMMQFPAGKNVHWSEFSKRRIHDQFKEEFMFPCLKWECGEYKPDDMFSDPKKKEILNKMCYHGYTIYPHRRIKSYFDSFVETYPNKPFYKVLKKNPHFFKEENVCKGIVCQKDSKIRDNKGEYLKENLDKDQDFLTRNAVKCGENKICQHGNCVRE